MDYPAGKEDLVKHAEEKGADEKVLSALKDLPNRKYETRPTLTRSSSKP
jgi:hypothetical protein